MYFSFSSLTAFAEAPRVAVSCEKGGDVVEIGSTTSLRWMSLRRWFLLCDGHLSDSCLVAALCLALRSRDALALMLHLAFEVRWSFVTEWFCWNYFYGQLRDMTDVELHVRMCDGYVTCDAESALHA